jgi:hypothetical protein
MLECESFDYGCVQSFNKIAQYFRWSWSTEITLPAVRSFLAFLKSSKKPEICNNSSVASLLSHSAKQAKKSATSSLSGDN